jgi:hypothetical protein
MIYDDECGTVGGVRISKGNRSTRRKPVAVPLCPQKIRHDLTWDRNRAAAVGSRRLTARAMARPPLFFNVSPSFPRYVITSLFLRGLSIL